MTTRSHNTQQLQNYFDVNDVRVRALPHSVDSSLLNAAASALDDVELKLDREAQSRTLARCPVQLDNRGVYWMARIPQSVEVPAYGPLPNGLTAVRGEEVIDLLYYDDLLPIPARIGRDPLRQAIPLTEAILFSVQSDLFEYSYGPKLLDIPNRLTFVVEGLGLEDKLSITIEGERAPRPVWPSQRSKASETLWMDSNGSMQSKYAWALIDRISVRGLGGEISLSCYQIGFGLPVVRDERRPLAHPDERDAWFPRYWKLEGALLKEVFVSSNLNGYDYAQSRSGAESIRDVSVEPDTWGMVAVSGNTLYYLDRREPMPAHLERVAQTEEPYFGLKVSYNVNKPGNTRYALLEPIANDGAGSVIRWRYLMEDPDGNLSVILPDGRLAPYTSSSGWQSGRLPKSVSVPLVYLDEFGVQQNAGTFLFSLECSDGEHTTEDFVPYGNFGLDAKARFDLTGLTMNVRGVAFDYRGNLWVWTGDYAVPLRFFYDAYLVEPDHRVVLLTDKFDEVRF